MRLPSRPRTPIFAARFPALAAAVALAVLPATLYRSAVTLPPFTRVHAAPFQRRTVPKEPTATALVPLMAFTPYSVSEVMGVCRAHAEPFQRSISPDAPTAKPELPAVHTL